MKEIFKLICLILGQVIRVSFYSKATHKNLAELEKLVDALPDDHEFLEDKLAPVEKDHLGVDRGTDASEVPAANEED